MKKKISLFYTIYFSLIVLFIVSLTVFLLWLSTWVSDYNSKIPETVSENFFSETFENLDTDRIIKLSGIVVSEFETQNAVSNYIKSNIKSPLSYTSVASGDDDVKRYIVKSGEYKVADFELVKKDDEWTPDKVNLHLPSGSKKTFSVLSTSTLMINGKAVSSSYETSRTPHESAEYLPENVTAPEWVTYTVDGLFGEPVFEVVDRNGNSPALVEKDGVLFEEIIWDKPDEKIAERILEGALQYAICMQNDASKSTVYPYFEKGTDLYQRIQSVENSFVWDHNGYEFKNTQIREFYRYDENTISVRISFVHILKMHGREDYRNPTDITYFARLIDGEYMIFACHNN